MKGVFILKNNKKRNYLIIATVLFLLVTSASLIVFADQENNFNAPCSEHEYQIINFDAESGEIDFECENCEEKHKELFAEHINERGYESIDMNHDGIVNAKDFAYLLHHYAKDD